MNRKIVCLSIIQLLLVASFVSALQLGVRWRSGPAFPGQVTAMVTGDPDRDNLKNFFIAVKSGNIALLLDYEAQIGDNTPIFKWKPMPEIMEGGIKAMVLGDYDNDGKQELTVAGNNGNYAVILTYEHTGVLGEDAFTRLTPLPTIPSGGMPVGIGITDLDHDGRKELSVGSNLVTGAAIAVYESTPTPANPNFVTLIHLQPANLPLQAFSVGDPDGNHPLRFPDQVLWTSAIPIPPTPTPLTVYSLSGGPAVPFSVAQITASAGSGTALAVADIDGQSGEEIIVGSRMSNTVATVSYIRYQGGGSYSAPETYQLPTQSQSVTSISADTRQRVIGFRTDQPPLVFGLSDNGGVIVARYGELRLGTNIYRSQALGGSTQGAIGFDPQRTGSSFDGDGLFDVLTFVGNEVLFLEDNTLIYLAGSSNPANGGRLQYQVKMPELPNSIGRCFLSFTPTSCQRYTRVEGCGHIGWDVLFHLTLEVPIAFTTNSVGDSQIMTFNIPLVTFPPGHIPGPVPVYAQCLVQSGSYMKLTNDVSVNVVL